MQQDAASRLGIYRMAERGDRSGKIRSDFLGLSNRVTNGTKPNYINPQIAPSRITKSPTTPRSFPLNRTNLQDGPKLVS